MKVGVGGAQKPSSICRQPFTRPVNRPHLTPWRKETSTKGSILSRVTLPPLGMVKILMLASTVPMATISAHSTSTRVLE